MALDTLRNPALQRVSRRALARWSMRPNEDVLAVARATYSEPTGRSAPTEPFKADSGSQVQFYEVLVAVSQARANWVATRPGKFQALAGQLRAEVGEAAEERVVCTR